MTIPTSSSRLKRVALDKPIVPWLLDEDLPQEIEIRFDGLTGLAEWIEITGSIRSRFLGITITVGQQRHQRRRSAPCIPRAGLCHPGQLVEGEVPGFKTEDTGALPDESFAF